MALTAIHPGFPGSAAGVDSQVTVKYSKVELAPVHSIPHSLALKHTLSPAHSCLAFATGRLNPASGSPAKSQHPYPRAPKY